MILVFVKKALDPQGEATLRICTSIDAEPGEPMIRTAERALRALRADTHMSEAWVQDRRSTDVLRFAGYRMLVAGDKAKLTRLNDTGIEMAMAAWGDGTRQAALAVA